VHRRWHGRGRRLRGVRLITDLRDEDIAPLLVDFYARVGSDDLLSPYFAHVDIMAHIPVIADFWSTTIFHTGRYAGNAFKPHLEMPGLTAAHFARWVGTLEATVDSRVAGPNAERMKSLGHRIAHSMQVRLGITPFEPYAAGDPGLIRLDRRD
jgi:hemoglobin